MNKICFKKKKKIKQNLFEWIKILYFFYIYFGHWFSLIEIGIYTRGIPKKINKHICRIWGEVRRENDFLIVNNWGVDNTRQRKWRSTWRYYMHAAKLSECILLV
jgi:hypothetical protein